MTRPGWAEVPFLFSFSRHFLPVSLSVQVALSFSPSLSLSENTRKQKKADHCARFVRNAFGRSLKPVSRWPVVLLLLLLLLHKKTCIFHHRSGPDYSQCACDAILLTYRTNVLSWLTSIKLPDSVMSNCCGACWPNDSQRLRESPWFTKAWRVKGRKDGYKLNEQAEMKHVFIRLHLTSGDWLGASATTINLFHWVYLDQHEHTINEMQSCTWWSR